MRHSIIPKSLMHFSSRRLRRHRAQPVHVEPLEARQLMTAEINGTIYDDADANAIFSQDDLELPNWTVYLDLNRNGRFDADEPSDTTNKDGDYAFKDLEPGDYRVSEVLQAGWTATHPSEGFHEATLVDGVTAHLDFLNAGTAASGSMVGRVWRDLNGNGSIDPGDTGVASWTVFLDLNRDHILDPDEPFQLTDGDGNYTFTGIVGGKATEPVDYEVQQLLTPGWAVPPGFSENYTVGVVEGEVSVVPDFAIQPTEISSIVGTVWNDLNANGFQDAGESGLGGWTIYADSNANQTLDAGEPSALTSPDGQYTLFGIVPGPVLMSQVTPTQYQPTSPIEGYQWVTAPNSGTLANVHFGNRLRTDASIGGTIYADRDHDGSRDANEEGLTGITVYIDENENGLMDADERRVLTSNDFFYTPDVDESGQYRFDKLPAGSYTIRQIVPAELSATPTTELVQSVSVGPIDNVSNLNLGDRYRPSEIHGVNFEDLNGNHLRDVGEPGVEGVTVFVDLNRNNQLDADEPRTLTAADGSYAFTGLAAGAYVVREMVPADYVQTFPQTVNGILWPSGTSHASVGDVTPGSLQFSLSENETHTEHVKLTLPATGALTNMVDVFLLFDDTGSFTDNSPIVRSAFPQIISSLQTRLPGIDLGFGVGRLEEYGSFADEYADGRPFVLNQPIVAASASGYSQSQVQSAIQAALDRMAPGYGGDTPETVIEALYQMVTGAGFDGDNNGSTQDSGPAGLASTQITPGNSGDVPSFASFTSDPTNGVLSPSGNIGGAGFRSGALPIIITATDTGFAYQPNGETTITGVDGLSVPVTDITFNGRGTTPFDAGAGIQETVTGLNALGALVIGLGTNDLASQDPRIGLEALASLTGAVNRTTTTISNGTTDAIAPGDPLYFLIGSGGDPLVGNIAEGIVAAIEGAVTAVSVNVTLRSSDPRVKITSSPGSLRGLTAGQAAEFDVTFTGDGRPHRFDLQFVREGTDVVLGSIPVVMGTPIAGDGYEFEDCHDGELSDDVNFGNQRATTVPVNHAPLASGDSYAIDQDSVLTIAAPGVLGNDSDVDRDLITARLVEGPVHGQLLFDAKGSFVYTPDAGYVGEDLFRYVANDGALESSLATVTLHVQAVNHAPLASGDSYAIDQDTVLTIAAPGVLGNDSDVDRDLITARLVEGPVHGQLLFDANGSFVYTPDAGYVGEDLFRYVANDGALESSLATATLHVQAVNHAPLASGDSYAIDQDTVLTIAAPGVLGNDSDVDRDLITARLVEGPVHGQLLFDAKGSFVYTPDAGYVGEDLFRYVANDGALESSLATVTLHVQAVNHAPLASGDSYVIDQDTVLTIAAPGVLGNDSDVDRDLITARLVEGPAHGQLLFDAKGSFVYTPDAGYAGEDLFRYVANDGALESSLATVTLTIRRVTTGGPKFFVVDASSQATFAYDASGVSLDTIPLERTVAKPRGIASNPTGSIFWTIGDDGRVLVKDAAHRTIGSWKLMSVDKPEGITVSGQDLWVVDNDRDRVFLVQNGAALRSGRVAPTSSFRLHGENQNPTDIVTDGSHFWVVNNHARKADEVFRYAMNGTLEGRWQLDLQNSSPTGITIDPNDVRHLWVVDSVADRVFEYRDATKVTSGNVVSAHSFALAAKNKNPQGIADPRAFGGSDPAAIEALFASLLDDDTALSSKKRS